jgi:pimeloyl-ACP methyl ester carboxylesterase
MKHLFFASALSLLAFSVCALAQERQADVPAGPATIHVTMRGTGGPIVLIPSFGRGADDFDDLSKRLAAAGFTALLPDPRGLGRSVGPMDTLTLHGEGDDIAAVIKALVPGGRAVVLGHAHGNTVARMVATDHPETVKEIILLGAGGSGMIPRAPDIEAAFRKVFDKSTTREERLAAVQKAFFAPGNDAKVWQDGWDFDVAAQQMAGVARVKLEEYWAGGKAQVFVLQGAEDVIAVPENSKRLRDGFPDRVTVVEIPHSGHAMLPEQPELVAKTIIEHLKR